MSCFRIEALSIPHLDVSITTTAIAEGTKDPILWRSLRDEALATLMDLLTLAQKHARCEENTVALGRMAGSDQPDRKRSIDSPWEG